MNVISERFYNTEQSWMYEKIVKAGKNKLRALIRRNAYDSQSYVHGYALDPDNRSWNLLVNKPIEGAHCFKANYVVENESKAPFILDAGKVFAELTAILED